MSANRRRTAVGITLLLVLGASTALVLLRRDSSIEIAVRTPKSNATSSTATTTPPTSTSEPSTTTTTLPAALEQGSTGARVAALQQRLVDLGFWLPSADGVYASDTTHAVVAFQKANGLTSDGTAGPLTFAALVDAERPQARTTTGHVIEIDLTRQLLLVVADGRVQWTFDTSTGAVPGTTPVGDFTVFRQVNGYDHSPLGVLYRPKYFVGGVAVHGYPSVPPYPASHGCVRVTNAAMGWLWANEALPIGTQVSVYE